MKTLSEKLQEINFYKKMNNNFTKYIKFLYEYPYFY